MPGATGDTIPGSDSVHLGSEGSVARVGSERVKLQSMSLDLHSADQA